MKIRPSYMDGYTLLELLVVMTIVGLCYTLVPTFVMGGNKSSEFNTSLQQIVSDMRSLRSQAVIKGEVLTFEVTESGQAYKIFGRVIFLGDELLLKAQINNTPNNQINFYPDGTSSDFKITLSLGGQSERISSEWPTGKIMVINDE